MISRIFCGFFYYDISQMFLISFLIFVLIKNQFKPKCSNSSVIMEENLIKALFTPFSKNRGVFFAFLA